MRKTAHLFPDLRKLYLVDDRDESMNFRTMDQEELKQENLENSLWADLNSSRRLGPPAWTQEGSNWKWPRFVFTTKAEFPSLIDLE